LLLAADYALMPLAGFWGIRLVLLPSVSTSLGPVQLVGWMLSLVFGALMIMSSAWVSLERARIGDDSRLVKTGFYRMARHPTLLFRACVFVSLWLASRSSLMLVTGIAWLVIEALYSWHRERSVYASTLYKYHEYARSTPFVSLRVPTVKR
jgi:protein-S-isoprenylcysteine O-methyltransferase Ste14